MIAAAHLLDTLRRQRPEWHPWLRVVETALLEAERPEWGAMVPRSTVTAGAAPRLAGATLSIPRAPLERCLTTLLQTASSGGTREMQSLQAVAGLDALDTFRAALDQAQDDLAEIAVRRGAEPGAFQAVAALLPVPFLHACRTAWGADRDWLESYCPVCGAWPAFVEVRGIERSRHYRCGRCGSDWHAQDLSCPYCATTDHRDLVRLVPDDPRASAAVEACRKCLGYVKTFNRLQGCAPLAVPLEDLGGVTLDLAALEAGYARPATPGYRLDVCVEGRERRG